MTTQILPHFETSVIRDAHGWPLNPATGQPYTHKQIVTNPAIPYPEGVDTGHPYWQRRTPAEYAAQTERRAKKRRNRARRRSTHRTMRSTAAVLTTSLTPARREQAAATLESVTRVNGDERHPAILLMIPAGMKVV